MIETPKKNSYLLYEHYKINAFLCFRLEQHYTLSQFIVLSHLNSFNDNTHNCDRTIAIDEMQISKIS